MVFLKKLWIKRVGFIFLLLALTIAFLTIFPVLKNGVNGIFFSIDPDVVYIANTLRYIKSGTIDFYAHPGTPAIRFMAQALLPFRIYSELLQTPFIDWAFNNFSFMYLYLRIVMSLILACSLFASFSALYHLTKKIYAPLLLALTLLSYSPFYYLGVSISPDPFSFLVVSLWLFVLSHYLYKENNIYIIFLFCLAGFSFAARATNFFVLPATFVLTLFIKYSNLKERATKLFLYIAYTFVGFLVGLWPLSKNVVNDITQVFIYGSTTGVHGEGARTYFDFSKYVMSIKSFIDRDFVATLIFLFIGLIALMTVFVKDKKTKIVSLIILIFIIGGFAFAKFPLAHYQITNYFVIVFFGAYLVSRYLNKIAIILLFVFLFTFIPIAKSHMQILNKAIFLSSNMEKFVKENPSKFAEVWDWSRTKQFSYLWTRDYSDGLFDAQLHNAQPGLFELQASKNKVRLSKSMEKEILDICWDNLYIQKQTFKKLLKSYPRFKNNFQETPDPDMYLVKSDHCVRI